MLTTKNFGKHTAYSRYASQKKPTNPHSWSHTIDTGLWMSRPTNCVRVLSLNLNRFPKTFYSKICAADIIMSSYSDIVILQEITSLSVARELQHFLNNYIYPYEFNLYFGLQSVTNLGMCILYNNSRYSKSYFQTLFLDHDDGPDTFPRLPFNLKLSGTPFDINITNIHLVSHKKVDNTIIRENEFEMLGDYFDWYSVNELVLLGGDFNEDTSSVLYNRYLSQFQIVYGSYHSNSDIILFLKQNYGPIIKSGFYQRLYDFNTYCNISNSDYGLYVSDHKPIILHMPI